MKPAPVPRDSSPHILLVDDNSHGLVARKAILEELGYRILTAKNGEEALELYSTQRIDVLVTDYKMPRMNGLQLIQEVRKSDSDARIILLSGFVEPLGLDEQSTGADVVIPKSSGEVGNLVRSVSRLLSRRPPRKPVASQSPAPRFKAKA